MLFYPRGLALWYPYDRTIPSWQIAVAVILLTGVTALCLWQINKRRYLIFGWLWFLGTLVPVIGLVQVGSQSMADRYTYVPYFGLFVMLAWGIGELTSSKKLFYGVFALAAVVFGAVSFQQTSYWKDSETVYRRALAVTQDNHLISHNLCHKLTLDERLDEAEPLCREAVRLKPSLSEAHNTLGIIAMKRQNYEAAAQHFRESLKFAPRSALVYANLATALALGGNPDEAESNLERAVMGNDSGIGNDVWIQSLTTLAATFAAQDKHQKAADNLRRLLALDPANAVARANLAFALFRIGRADEAGQQVDAALQSNSSEVVATLRKALEIDPKFADVNEKLSKLPVK
jgi:Flp pilus assembly protein TadD